MPAKTTINTTPITRKNKRIKLRDKNIYDMVTKGVFKPKVVASKKKNVKKFRYNAEEGE